MIVEKCIYFFYNSNWKLKYLFFLSENNMFELVEDFYVCTFAMLHFSSTVLAFIYGDKIIEFFVDLSQIRSEIKGIYGKKIIKFDKITKFLYISAVVDMFLISVASYAENRYCDLKEHMDDPHYVCGTIIPLWYPIEINESMRPLVAIYCTLFAIFMVPQFAAGAIVFFTPLFITVRIQHLIYLLKKLEFSTENAEQNRFKLNVCLDYYTEITR